MISDYEYIQLVFENCNTVKISPENVLFLDILGVTDWHWINAVGQYSKHSVAKSVTIGLKNDAINLQTHFQIEFPNDKHSDSSSFKRHLDVYRDITTIYIKPNGKDEFGIIVPWSDDGNDRFCPSNLLQKVEYGEKEFTISLKE